MNSRLFEVLISARQVKRRLFGCIFLALACNSPVQIEYVELCARMTQQMRDVAESSYILQTKCFPTIADGPVDTLLAEDPFLSRTETWLHLARIGRDLSGARRIACHLCFL